MERGLSDNFHYRYCRRLGQLGPVGSFRVRRGALETYLAGCLARGQRLGDIKPTALHPASGWSRRFDGYSVAAGSVT